MLVIAFLVGILLKDVGIVLMVGNLDVVSIGTEKYPSGQFYTPSNNRGDNPLSKIRTYKLFQSQLSFLTVDQIKILLKSCKESTNDHLYPVVLLCLATGAGFSEANGIKRQNLLADRVVFTDTKNGSNRVVPVPPSLIRYLTMKAYPSPFNRLFASCKIVFRKAVQRAKLDLPDGQLTHILRHTFASHFIMNGGSLKVLQEVLDHEDIKTTMIYAHLAPDYLESVLDLGVYSELRRQSVGIQGDKKRPRLL